MKQTVQITHEMYFS